MVAAALVLTQSAVSSAPSTSFDNGVIGEPVTLSNYNDTGVVRWVYSWVDVPFDSGFAAGVIHDGVTAAESFTPDVPGVWQLQLTVYDANTPTPNSATSIQDFIIYDAEGRNAFYPAFQDTPATLNEPGNVTGWKKLNKTIKDIARNAMFSDVADGATTGQVKTWNGSAWVPETPAGGGGGGGTVAGFSDNADARRTVSRGALRQIGAGSIGALSLPTLGIPLLTDNGPAQPAGASIAMVGSDAYFAGYDTNSGTAGALYGVDLVAMASLTPTNTPVHVYPRDTPVTFAVLRDDNGNVPVDYIFAACSTFVELGTVDGLGGYAEVWHWALPAGVSAQGNAVWLLENGGSAHFAFAGTDGNIYVAEPGALHVAYNAAGHSCLGIVIDDAGYVWIADSTGNALLQCTYNPSSFTFTVAHSFPGFTGSTIEAITSDGRFICAVATVSGVGCGQTYDLQSGAQVASVAFMPAPAGVPGVLFDGVGVWYSPGGANHGNVSRIQTSAIIQGTSICTNASSISASSTRAYRGMAVDDSGAVVFAVYDTSLPGLVLSLVLPTESTGRTLRANEIVPTVPLAFARGGRIQGTAATVGGTVQWTTTGQIARLDPSTLADVTAPPSGSYPVGFRLWAYDGTGTAATDPVTVHGNGVNFENPAYPGRASGTVVLSADSFSVIWEWTGTQFKVVAAFGFGGTGGGGLADLTVDGGDSITANPFSFVWCVNPSGSAWVVSPPPLVAGTRWGLGDGTKGGSFSSSQPAQVPNAGGLLEDPSFPGNYTNNPILVENPSMMPTWKADPSGTFWKAE